MFTLAENKSWLWGVMPIGVCPEFDSNWEFKGVVMLNLFISSKSFSVICGCGSSIGKEAGF